MGREGRQHWTQALTCSAQHHLWKESKLIILEVASSNQKGTVLLVIGRAKSVLLCEGEAQTSASIFAEAETEEDHGSRQ